MCTSPQREGSQFPALPESHHFLLWRPETWRTRAQSAGTGPHWPPRRIAAAAYTCAGQQGSHHRRIFELGGTMFHGRPPRPPPNYNKILNYIFVSQHPNHQYIASLLLITMILLLYNMCIWDLLVCSNFTLNLNCFFPRYSPQYPALGVFHLTGGNGGHQVDEAASGVADRVNVVRPSCLQDSPGAQVSAGWNLPWILKDHPRSFCFVPLFLVFPLSFPFLRVLLRISLVWQCKTRLRRRLNPFFNTKETHWSLTTRGQKLIWKFLY